MKNSSYSLILHGGAGSSPDLEPREKGLETALDEGRKILELGGSAVDAVQSAIEILEDDPAFNAGRGSAIGADGNVEMDASIADGAKTEFGGVIGVSGVKNPIILARKVMDETQQALLRGQGARDLAEAEKLQIEDSSYFITERKRKLLEAAKKRDSVSLVPENRSGTVGAAAVDSLGRYAAATSTGGLTNKPLGRVSDSAIPGAGILATEIMAGSATGKGEHFIRTMPLSGAEFEFNGDRYDLTVQSVADLAISKYLGKVDGGWGGVILVGPDGSIGRSHSTPHMAHGFVTNQAKTKDYDISMTSPFGQINT